MKKLLLFLFSFFALATTVEASLFRSYQTEDGLSHNSVWAVMQDSRGFLWFGTNDGLNRFDGVKFKIYRRKDGDSLSLGNNFIHCLIESPKGEIFVGTKQGLYRYNPSTDNFTHINLNGEHFGSDRNSVHQLVFDEEGSLWVGCYGQGIYQIAADNNIRHFTEPTLPSRFVTTLTYDNQGNLWVGTDNKGLFKLNIKTGKSSPTPLSKENIQSVYRQNNNILWIGTSSSGLIKYDPRSKISSQITLSPSGSLVHDIKAITPIGNNTLIMGSENGLIKLDLTNKKLEAFDDINNYDNLPDNSIFAITQDSEGSLWLGTYYHGVCYWSPRINAFSFFPLDKGRDIVSSNLVRKLSLAPDGKIILTSQKKGVSVYDPSNNSVSNLKIPGLSDNIQFAVPIDNNLWVSDYDRGIMVIPYPSGKISKTFTTKEGLPSNVVNTMYRNSAGNIYVGTARGAAIFNDTGFVKIPELENAAVMTILEDYEGNIWFATHFHGLFKMTPEGKFENYNSTSTNLPGNNINNIFIDSRGKIWAGTEGEGLAVFNPTTAAVEKKFTENSGLPSDIIYSAQEDADGNMWISTGGGLVKISNENDAIETFRYIENLLKIHYTHNSSLFDPQTENLYFGGSGGVLVFNPDNIVKSNVAPVTGVIDFTANGLPVAEMKERLELESNGANFSIDVACLSYLSPLQNTIAYRLEGYDSDWKTLTGNDRHIEYMNLPWGDYKLYVKGANCDGVWSDPVEMDVHINRPLLMSNAMLFVYAVLLLGGIWLAKNRIEKHQKKKMVRFSHAKEKELYEAKIGFFTNIAHEIRTPLSLISAPLETILASGDGTVRTRHNLQVMQSNVNRLLELINQLLDFRKVEAQLMKLNFQNCDVSKIVSDICERYVEFANLNMIKINTSGIVPDIHCNIDAEAFEKIVGNLMSNATKFANKKICVKLLSVDNTLRLEISDDGPGIKEKDIERVFESFYQVDDHGKHPGSGLGLPLARRLAEMHSGYLNVESEYGKGCTFILSIPLTLDEGELKETKREDAAPAAIADEDKESGAETYAVLVVEDNEQLRRFISENLSDNYNVMTAGNGVEAIKVLERKNIDLIVSDIMMPDMDGIELAKAVRTKPVFTHIPIVLLSAKTDVETKVEGLNIGADAYIEKPFSIEQLKAQVKSIFDSRRRLQESLMKSPLDFYKHQQTEDFHETENAEFVNRLNDLIIENLTNNEFNIDTAAREFALSRSSFHNKVKSITGETPNNYIRIVRLCKAAELLASGKYQIVEVCYLVGFNTPSYFSKCFAEHFGKLPKDYVNDINN